MRHIARVLLLLALVGASAAAQPATTSLSELLMKPDRFEGKRVTVRGSISNFNEHTAFGSRSYTFDLDDGPQSIRVFASARPPCQDGPVLVDGTFQKQKAQRFILGAKVTCGASKSE
jgi:hypothetical protein